MAVQHLPTGPCHHGNSNIGCQPFTKHLAEWFTFSHVRLLDLHD